MKKLDKPFFKYIISVDPYSDDKYSFTLAKIDSNNKIEIILNKTI